MSEEQINIIMTELKGFRELMEERFNQTDEEHQKTNAHLEKLNGQVAENSEFVIQQKNNNRWIFGFLTLIIIPVLFLVIEKI